MAGCVGQPTSNQSKQSSIAAGQSLFATHCANCHGTYADGNGIMAPALSVAMKDLRYLSARNNNRFPRAFVSQIIDGRDTRAAHGPADMPVWGDIFLATAAQSSQEGSSPSSEHRLQTKIDSISLYLEYIQQTQ